MPPKAKSVFKDHDPVDTSIPVEDGNHAPLTDSERLDAIENRLDRIEAELNEAELNEQDTIEPDSYEYGDNGIPINPEHNKFALTADADGVVIRDPNKGQ